MSRVAILGCGPAGLAAAHAVLGMGRVPVVFAPKKPSPLRGPLLLQRPIPGITTDHPDAYIKQIVVGGSILDYRYKLYGDVNIAINGDILEDGYHAWRMGSTYLKMWDLYHSSIEDVALTPDEVSGLEASGEWELVISTAPADRICERPDEHQFISATVELLEQTSYPNQPDNTIVFNGDRNVEWARSSSIFGYESTEWPSSEVKTKGRITIRKPIRTDCTCHPTVLRTGRFGAWKNETWVDTAYSDARRALLHADHGAVWSAVV